MSKVIIATPIHRAPNHNFWLTRNQVKGTAAAEVASIDLWHESLICRARNELASAFLDTDAEWLYFWDDDLSTENTGGAAGNLIDMLLSHGVPVVGGIYSTKGTNPHNAYRPLEARADRRLWPVKYLAGGSMLIRRDVIERMNAAYPELGYAPYHDDGIKRRTFALFQPFICGEEYLGEDYAFCERWRRLGGEVYADLDVKLNHWGDAPYALRDPREA